MDLDAVEGLLCERYNVAQLPAGALLDAMTAARSGDVTTLKAALAGRELYRWREPIEAALVEEGIAEAEEPALEEENEEPSSEESGEAEVEEDAGSEAPEETPSKRARK